jgi:hypothetical protein
MSLMATKTAKPAKKAAAAPKKAAKKAGCGCKSKSC